MTQSNKMEPSPEVTLTAGETAARLGQQIDVGPAQEARPPMNWTVQQMPSAGRVLITIPTLLAGLSARDLTLAVVVIVVTALCWVLKDNRRTRRLAMLISACRDSHQLPPSG